MKPSNMIKNRHKRLDKIAKKIGRNNVKNIEVTWAVLDNAIDDMELIKGGHYDN